MWLGVFTFSGVYDKVYNRRDDMNHQSRKEQILSEAEARGLTTKDLKILTTDPYLVGSDGEYQDANWAAKWWDKMMDTRKRPIHIRGFYYWLYNNAKKPNGKTFGAGVDDPMKDWRWLMHASQVARYLSIGEWKGLIDIKHPEPQDYDEYSADTSMYSIDDTVPNIIKSKLNDTLEGIIQEALRLAPAYEDSGFQTYHAEVWCEKGSMGSIIEPICRRARAAYQPLVGQASVEKVEMLARRAIKAVEAGKKVRIWYIADWDRYGWTMVAAVARKLEFFIVRNGIEGADVKLARLALSEDQIAKYNLPKSPKKGEAVVELDALDAIYPGELDKIIKGAVNPYVDAKGPNVVREENYNMKERLRQILENELRPILMEQLKPQIDQALERIPMEDLNIDIKRCIDRAFTCPERNHEVEEDDTWMFDSNRSWFEQLERFKQYKESREEEAT